MEYIDNFVINLAVKDFKAQFKDWEKNPNHTLQTFTECVSFQLGREITSREQKDSLYKEYVKKTNRVLSAINDFQKACVENKTRNILNAEFRIIRCLEAF